MTNETAQQRIMHLLKQGVEKLLKGRDVPFPAKIMLTRCQRSIHGDFTSNVAFQLASVLREPPVVIAKNLVHLMAPDTYIAHCDVGGGGFVNFFLAEKSLSSIIPHILSQKEFYGQTNGRGKTRVLLEFVSANPTGPLHIGHGRGAVFGDVLSHILEASGYDVDREYYVNDGGRQINILALSVWLIYLRLCGKQVTCTLKKGYQGAYITDVAKNLVQDFGPSLISHEHHQVSTFNSEKLSAQLADNEEATMDTLITRMRATLGEDVYQSLCNYITNYILKGIRLDLDALGVNYHLWFKEKSLMASNKITKALQKLRNNHSLYDQDGAVWFRSTTYGDSQDRVVIRANGIATYFATDIAYHVDKFERGYDLLINVWGADHHGYVARLKAAMQACGYDQNKLHIVLVQFVSLVRNKEKKSMSTRSGSFIPLTELLKTVGRDAARFFYLLRKYSQHIEFDVDLALRHDSKNPVYYVQYAHARVCSLLAKADVKADVFEGNTASEDNLQLAAEKDILELLAYYPQVVEQSSHLMEPHRILHYLKSVAGLFHSYYNSTNILAQPEISVRMARISLVIAIKQVLGNGLRLAGINAPERM